MHIEEDCNMSEECKNEFKKNTQIEIERVEKGISALQGYLSWLKDVPARIDADEDPLLIGMGRRWTHVPVVAFCKDMLGIKE